ncbi:hypothetical protein G3R49_19255 [Shewanella sp. WXL01]|uniref:hypothetical protein n=1 Tax=Shewanella sp. WXL01 TaxID=2709721 RepID=UPI0014383F06|nr:hypothetical protein [Shewanella sp. WXL01]NKF52697.1 hypothetical protein [Shewanella sp. WXL01]
MNIAEIRKNYPAYGDLTDDALARALHRKNYSDMSFEDFSERIGHNPYSIGDTVRSAAQGLTFGFGDEIEAGVKSAFGDNTYEEEVDAIRKRMGEYSQDNPWEAGISEVVGSAPLMLIPGVGWAKNASTASKLGKLAGEGAGYGAAYGAGTSEANPLDAPVDFITDVGTGAGVGAVASPVGYGIGKKIGDAITPDKMPINKLKHEQNYNIDPSLADISPTLGKVSGVLDETTGGLSASKGRAGRDESTSKERLDNLGSLKSAEEVGDFFINNHKNWLKGNEKDFEEAYGFFNKKIGADTEPADTSSTVKMLEGSRKSLSAMADVLTPTSYKKIEKVLKGEKPMELKAMIEFRSDVGHGIKSEKLGSDDVRQGKLKNLYSALTEDIDATVKRLAGKDGYDDYVALNDRYKEFLDVQNDVRDLYNKRGKTVKGSEFVEAVRLAYQKAPERLRPYWESLFEHTPNYRANKEALDDAGESLIRQFAFKGKDIDPIHFAERYGIADRKKADVVTEKPHIYLSDTLDEIERSLTNQALYKDYVNSPVSDFISSPERAREVIGAVKTAQRASDSADKASMVGHGLSSGLPAIVDVGSVVGGSLPIATVISLVSTYGINRALNSPRVGKQVLKAVDALAKLPPEMLSPEQAQLLYIITAQQMVGNQAQEVNNE